MWHEYIYQTDNLANGLTCFEKNQMTHFLSLSTEYISNQIIKLIIFSYCNRLHF